MADDFADMFTYRGSIREEDVIDISDDEDEIEEEFETFTKKRGRTPTLGTTKKLKTSSESRSISNSNSSISSSSNKTLSISIDDDDEITFVNNNNNNNDNSNNNNNNSSNNNNKNNQVFLLDDEDEDLKPRVYKKTNLQSFLKQNSNLNSNTNKSSTTTPINNKYNSTSSSNGFYSDSIYGSSPLSSSSISSSPQQEKKKNEGIPLVLKLAGEPNEKIVFYFDTPIQKLLDLYCGKKNLDSTSAQFKLYGLILDSKKTPRELNLMDDDVLEVTIKASEPLKNLDEITANMSTTSTSTTSSSLPTDDDTPKVILKVTYDKQTHKFKIGMTDPFSKLITVLTKKIGVDIPDGKKIVLKFDGMALSPSATPESEDMEDDFIIEAFLK